MEDEMKGNRVCECGSTSFQDYNGKTLDCCTECAQFMDKPSPLDISTAQVGDELMTTAWGVAKVKSKEEYCILLEIASGAVVAVSMSGKLFNEPNDLPSIVTGWYKDGKVYRERPVEEVELLPCPFCGGNANYRFFVEESVHIVLCSVCEAQVDTLVNEGAARRKWNTRTPQPKS